MIEISEEQKKVIDCVKNKNFVIIDAVAGSGKTTTIIELSNQLHEGNILQITYNAHLKKEVREKAEKHKIRNLEVHTYHSFCYKYYGKYKDEEIQTMINNNLQPNKQFPEFSILVIDEAQDMRNIFYKLICKFLCDYGKKIIIVIAGDKFQGIYEFNDADTRYLTMANKLYNTNFIFLDFKTSYRVTPQISLFINNHIIGYDRIISGNTNKKSSTVKYIICNKKSQTTTDYIVSEIKRKIKKGYSCSDFFIMSYSIKDNEFLKTLENKLVANNFAVYYENSDEERPPENKLINNKIVFTTIHCSKGRERKFVFFNGFDSTFDHFCKRSNKDPTICSPELYVGLTRSNQELYLIHSYKKNIIGCLKNYDNLVNKDYVKMINLAELKPYEKIKPQQYIFSVTSLVSHLGNTLLELQEKINEMFEQLKPPNTLIKITDTIENTELNIMENVTDINGLTIPMILEQLQSGECHILKQTKNKINQITQDESLIKKIKEVEFTKDTLIDEYLKIGTFYSCINSQLIHKINQINNYNWLDMKEVNKCHNHLRENLSNKIKWEVTLGNKMYCNQPIFSYIHPNFGTIKISNRIDAMDDTTIWELKCVNDLLLEHKLQLIIYYFIHKNMESTQRDFKLLNMKSGEVLKLNPNETYIDHIINKVLETKILTKDRISDDNFLKLCQTNDYYNKMMNICEIEKEPYDVSLKKLNITELKKGAKELGLKKYSKCNKNELINMMLNFAGQ